MDKDKALKSLADSIKTITSHEPENHYRMPVNPPSKKELNRKFKMTKTKNESLNIPYQPLLIEHKIEGEVIAQRPIDGYINATALCKKAGKEFKHYNENKQTKDFINVLSAEVGIPTSALIQIIRGGDDHQSQGTWVHPQVAIHLAQWLSPEFAVWVSKWVFEWMSGNIQSGKMPEHLRRYVANMGKVPNGYFSMLNEAMYSLIAPLEQRGYIMPSKLMPDISYGRMFSGFLRDKGIRPETFPEYEHEFINSDRPNVNARLYPNKYLGEFRDYLENEWIPKQATRYFNKADKKAIPYVQDILKGLPPPVKKVNKNAPD